MDGINPLSPTLFRLSLRARVERGTIIGNNFFVTATVISA